MNFTFFLLKKAPLVFLLLLCFVISFNNVEAGKTIRIKKIKTHIAPRHISISARSGNGIYARRYAHGRPIPSFSTNLNKNRRYYAGRSPNNKRGNPARTYASRYKNWSPNRNFYGGKNSPRVDSIQRKKRKELYPFLVEPPLKGGKHKRRVRPNRPISMQRPKPPKGPNEFDEDYYFPEEAKRAETKYEFENRYPRPKKKRRPEFEYSYQKPESIPFYDSGVGPFKTKTRDPAFSYSSFVRHPSELSDDVEEFYEDPDNHFSQPVVRNKKKKTKKKSNSKKKNKPFVFESEQENDNFPPYISNDEFELPTKPYKKRNKPSYDLSNEDDEFLPSKSYTKTRPLFSTDSEYKGSQKTHTAQYSPTYSQSWSQVNAIETTARPVYLTENGFQPQYVPSQSNYNKDYSSLQKTKTVTTNSQQSTYYSQPDNTYQNTYNNYVSNQVSHSQTPSNNAYSQQTYSQPTHSQPTYSQSTHSQTTYSQPSPSQQTYSQPTYSQPSSSFLTDVTIQKSVPIYDNTETFYNFNKNAYINGQTTKYQDTDKSYGSRLSYLNKSGDKSDSDSEFIKKHQNLYNNGLAGIPIQGDGYAKENKKDYDIGYGDFQFDENPNS